MYLTALRRFQPSYVAAPMFLNCRGCGLPPMKSYRQSLLLAMDFLQVKFKNYYLFIADDRDIR